MLLFLVERVVASISENDRNSTCNDSATQLAEELLVPARGYLSKYWVLWSKPPYL